MSFGGRARDSVLSRLGLAVLSAVLLASPVSAVWACAKTGKLAGLIRYAGTNYGDLPTTLEDDPAVQARLQRLPETVRKHLRRNLEVRGPVDLVGCHLVVRGNAPQMGGAENAILDVNLYSGAVTVANLSKGRITIHLQRDPTAGSGYYAVPHAVRRWAAAAATGFSAEQNPPPNVQIITVQ